MDYKNDAYEEQVASYDMSNVSIITFNELLNMLRLEMLCLETQDNALWQGNTMAEVSNPMPPLCTLDMFPALAVAPGPTLTQCPSLLCEVGPYHFVLFLK